MAKIYLEDIKKQCEELSWELLSNSYTNLDTEMNFRCPNGHEIITTYGRWRNTHKCPDCKKEESKDKEVEPDPNARGCTIAIDQALNTSGYAVFDGPRLIKSGTSTQTQFTQVEKMASVKQWVLQLCKEYNPTRVLIEDIQLEQNLTKGENGRFKDNGDNVIGVTTFKSLAQLQGVLLNAFFEQGIEVVVVFSGTWRKALCIKGRSRTDRKRSAQLKVKDWYGLVVSEDEAEAICMGRYGISGVLKKDELIQW